MAISSLAKNFINLIYPLHCAACRRPLDPGTDGAVCSGCISDIARNPEPHCIWCGKPVEAAGSACDDCTLEKPTFSIARSAYLYNGPLKELIHEFKYKSRLSLAETLSDLLCAFLCDDHSVLDAASRVTFVPMAARRMRKRGFNQSLVLARSVSENYGIPLVDCMEKYHPTRSQNELSRDERLANLRGAFRVKDAAAIDGETVLIVDDVMTTGATLNECAKALIGAGAHEVRGVTLARGL